MEDLHDHLLQSHLGDFIIATLMRVIGFLLLNYSHYCSAIIVVTVTTTLTNSHRVVIRVKPEIHQYCLQQLVNCFRSQIMLWLRAKVMITVDSVILLLIIIGHQNYCCCYWHYFIQAATVIITTVVVVIITTTSFGANIIE